MNTIFFALSLIMKKYVKRIITINLGTSLVKEVQGYHCEKCRRFMLTEADMTAHVRSITHYRNFLQEVKSLAAAATEAAAKTEPEVPVRRTIAYNP